MILHSTMGHGQFTYRSPFLSLFRCIHIEDREQDYLQEPQCKMDATLLIIINMTAKEVLVVSIWKQKRLLIWYKQLSGYLYTLSCLFGEFIVSQY